MSFLNRKVAACLLRSRFQYNWYSAVLRMSTNTTENPFSGGGKKGKKSGRLYNILRKKPDESETDTITIPAKGMNVNDISQAASTDRKLVYMALESIGKEGISSTKVLPPHIVRQILRKLGRTSHIMSNAAKGVQQAVNKDITPQCRPNPTDLVKRPPVVTIMGHVDHGKTTLLDTLRKTRVVDQEFGGITQHIGAFTVKLDSGEHITFLDTPGHAAFSAMRERGAMVTDIVVLVVAADDGVMQQTVESIQFANQAGVSVIVAVNKIDKVNADVERSKRMLLDHGITIEEMGGDVQCVPISALKGTNLDALKDAIITEAEILDIKGDPKGMVEGTVIEATAKQGKGKISTALIQRGTLKKNDVFVAGKVWGKVRSMRNDAGRLVTEAGPSCAVEISGWREIPSAGDQLWQVESESRAQEVIRWREQEKMKKKAGDDAEACQEFRQAHKEEYRDLRMKRLSMGYFKTRVYNLSGERSKVINTHDCPVLSIIVKGDVDGSVDAIVNILSTYPSKYVHLHIVEYGVGPVTEAEIGLAQPFGGIIYCFNVPIDAKMKRRAKADEVQLKEFNVIYELIDDLKSELNQRVETVQGEFSVLGEADVVKLFNITVQKKKKLVAGSKCTSGTLYKNKLFRIKRNEAIIHEGSLESLKHLKDEVESIKTDTECGLMFKEEELVLTEGDIVECGEYVDVIPEIEWNLDF